MADNLQKQPVKGILKNSSSFDKQDARSANFLARRKSKETKWDEMNIIATLHPADKDYGHMKIDEPKTPYNYRDNAEGADTLDAADLAEKIRLGTNKPAKVLAQSDSESDDDEDADLTPEERQKKKEFESKRKKHYNEYYAVKLARKLLEEEEEDDDEEDNAKPSPDVKPLPDTQPVPDTKPPCIHQKFNQNSRFNNQKSTTSQPKFYLPKPKIHQMLNQNSTKIEQIINQYSTKTHPKFNNQNTVKQIEKILIQN